MRWKDEQIFCSLLIAFLFLGLLYSVVNPIFEAPDEIWHYAFVRHLATGGGLPIYKPGEEALFRQEGFQPPLYYALGALSTFWVNTSDMESFVRPNPHAAIGYAGADGNRNAFIHSDRERFPYQGTSLAVHVARLVSLLWGAVTVIATYLTARELFPGGKGVPLGAAALVAFSPQFLFIHSAVSNDTAVTALSAVVVLLGVLLLTQGISTPCLAGLGVILGLALVAKLSALPLLAWTVVALMVAHLKLQVSGSKSQVVSFQFPFGTLNLEGGTWKLLLRRLALVFGLTSLIGGWWYLRNWFLYGDPLAQEIWYAALGRSSRSSTPLIDLLPELGGAGAFLLGGLRLDECPGR